MNDEIKEILDRIETASEIFDCLLKPEECTELLDYITNLQHQISLMEEDIRESKEINGELQQENKIKDTNWESLKYYLEKLYYKDYIEEAISDDIDKKIKELESKVEIKGYQKDIKALQQENERKERLITQYGEGMCAYANRIDKAIEYINNYFVLGAGSDYQNNLLNILQNGSDEDE